MATLTAKTVRLACNQASADSSLDILTGKRPIFWRGAAAAVQCALFNGTPGVGTFITDTSNIGSVELLIRKHNPVGDVLVDIFLLTADITDSSYAEWVAGTGQQFTFNLAEAYTSFPVLASGSLPIFYGISVITSLASYIAAQGYGQIVDVGIVDIAAPALPTGFFDLRPAADGHADITMFRGNAVVRCVAQVAAPAYIYAIVLPPAHVFTGSLVDVYIEIPATANVTIEVRDTFVSGPLLHTITGDTDNITYQRVLFRYDGNVWIKFGPEVT